MEERPSPDPKNPLTSTISRRRLLINSGIVVGGAMLVGPLAACGASPNTATTSTSPKRGGNFRLGVTGGGSGDIIDGQKIVTKPDQARLVAGFGTLLVYDKHHTLPTPRPTAPVTQAASGTGVLRRQQGIPSQSRQTL